MAAQPDAYAADVPGLYGSCAGSVSHVHRGLANRAFDLPGPQPWSQTPHTAPAPFVSGDNAEVGVWGRFSETLGPYRATRIGIVAPLVTGVAGVAGYASRSRWLAGPSPAWEVLTPVGAVLLIVAAVGLWASGPPGVGRGRRVAGRGAGLLVTTVAAVVLVEHFTDRGFGLDLVLFPQVSRAWAAAGEQPGRPLAHTAVAYLLVGLALLMLDLDADGGFRPAQVLAASAALVAGVAVVYPVLRLAAGVGSARTPMPVVAVVAVLALSAGLLACRPVGVVAGVLRSRGQGGSAVRGLALTTAVVAVTAALLAATVLHGSEPTDDLTVVLLVSVPLLILGLVLLRTGFLLDRAEGAHRDVARTLRDQGEFNRAVVRSMSEGVLTVDATGTVLEASPRWCEMTGYRAADTVGARPPYPWWPQEVVAERLALLRETVHGSDRREFEGPIVRADGSMLEVLGTVCPIRGTKGQLRHAVLTYRDLSYRHRAAAERRRMAERLDHFFTMSQDLMCIAGVDGYFKQLNPCWEQTFGYPVAELTGRPFVEFVHPDDRAVTAAATARLAAGGSAVVGFENRYRRSDGSYRWLSWNATVVPDEGLIYAVARDCTARHEADDTRARLAAIVDSTADAVIGKDLDGTIISWNPAAERIYGYRAGEVIGRPITIIFPPEDLAQAGDILARLARGETVKMHDAVRRRKDGGTVHLALTISPIRDATGAVIGAASIAHDIFETRQAEERFQRLVLSAPDAMVIVDEAGVLRLVNEQAEQMFGYPCGDLTGRPVEVLVPERARAAHVGQRARYLTEPTVRNMRTGIELYGVRCDGTQFPIEVSLAPLQTDEGTLVAAAIRDVTQRRAVETALAAARDAALAAAEIKSQFVAKVSHEIRTPMNGVIGLTNLLLGTTLDQVQRRYATSIGTSAQALLTIINDILDFSKIEAGKIELVESDFDLGNLLDEVAYTVADAARDKPLEILTDYPPDLPPAVRGDAGRLRQILVNLAGNAVKFTPHGEVVLGVEAGADPNGYVVSVTDTGIGIEPGDLTRLFEPFTQADNTPSRQFGGTGLGLSISRQLVDLMGGTLRVDSRPGRGSHFFFTLVLPATERPDRRPAGRDRLIGRRLLIVTDNQTAARHLLRHARYWGMQARRTNAEQAITHLRETAHHGRPYQHIVVDQGLPDGPGTALAREIRSDPAHQAPTLLLLAATIDAVAAPDPVDVLVKPVGPTALYNYLVHALHPDNSPPHQQPPTAGARRQLSPTRGTILLAEDNEINQLVAVATLTNLGYRIDVANNGVEALELAAARPYDAILMDCQMPTLDGYETTRELRRRESHGEHIPIIAMTAGARVEDRQKCLAAGMDDHLAKPIDPGDLHTVLQRWTHPASTDTGNEARPKRG